VIICAYCGLNEKEAKKHKPKLVFVDEFNRIVQMKSKEKNPYLVPEKINRLHNTM